MKQVIYPSYAEVMTGLSTAEHREWEKLYGLYYSPFTPKKDKEKFLAELHAMADAHNWDHESFMDVIEEEFYTLYYK